MAIPPAFITYLGGEISGDNATMGTVPVDVVEKVNLKMEVSLMRVWS